MGFSFHYRVFSIYFLINLRTKCKGNLRNCLRNNSWEIYVRNYSQDMLVNI